jgi:hypothetical protein
MNGKLRWEPLLTPTGPHSSETDFYSRAKVPGGWLVRWMGRRKEVGRRREADEPAYFGAITFYPDADHEWDGGSLP